MTRNMLAGAILALAYLPSPLRAQGVAAVPKPRIEAGFASDRLAGIDQVLQRYVDENQITCAVGLVMRDGRIVYERAVGWADKESGRRMTPDAIFRIASQSKALTSTAILILMEEGKLGLEDPVSRSIPEFAHTTVAIKSDTGRVIAPAKRVYKVDPKEHPVMVFMIQQLPNRADVASRFPTLVCQALLPKS